MNVRKAAATLLAAVVALGVGALASQAGDDFQGTWKVRDSQGKPFEITIAPDGKATGTQRPNMTGNWQPQGSGVVVTWNNGWTTKIEKSDDHYTHSGWRPGAPSSANPASTSDAEKVK